MITITDQKVNIIHQAPAGSLKTNYRDNDSNFVISILPRGAGLCHDTAIIVSFITTTLLY